MWTISDSTPETVADLEHALSLMLSKRMSLPEDKRCVQVKGSAMSSLDSLAIDLTGASAASAGQASADEMMGKAVAPVRPLSKVAVKKLEVRASPMRIDDAAVNILAALEGATLGTGIDANGRTAVRLDNVESGMVDVRIDRSALEHLASNVVKEIAKAQGVKVEKADLALERRGPGTIDAAMRVQAKKAFVSARVTLHATVEIDQSLVARLSNVKAVGEGMGGNIAAGLIRGRLEQANGKAFDLANGLGTLSVRELNLNTDDGVHLQAKLGPVG